ncbi:MAG: IS1634 family transposase [Pseudomonadota bacterium]
MPGSPLEGRPPEWLEQSVWASEVPDALYDEKLYRAMDFLLETDAALQKKVFFSTADLLSLEVDLLLYDTTSSYFEMEWDDEERQEREARWEAFERGEGPEPSRPRPQVVNDPPLRMHGHSKDHRPDLAQIVVGMAVTREGIPVRCWTFEGNRNDAATIEQVKKDLAGWRLNRVVWAVDRGMVSEENLLTLRRGGAHYIAGEKMRSGKESVEEALSRPGRYKTVRDNLEVKEVVVGTGERRRRYVVVRNPSGEVRDQLEREGHLKRLETALARLPENPEEYTKEVHRLVAHRTLGRYLRLQKGRPVLDRKKIKSEERLDGKYLLVTSDDSLSPEDVALGYKQLLEVERAWRDMKSGLDLRPMHHRKAERIRAHVLLCWLALLLVRVIETRTGRSWPRVRQEMDRLHNGVFENDAVRVVRRTETTPLQSQLLKALEIAPPPLLESIEKKRRGDPKSAS